MVPKSILKNLKKANKTHLALAVFALLIAVLYGNTLANGFVLDDEPVVLENPYIQSFQHLPKVVTGCIWEAALGGCEGRTLHYRPIVNLSYLLTWQISSSPRFFHFVNLLYFLGVVFLVFLLLKSITKNFTLSFLAALVFLFHPINSEAVNWISAVADLTFGLFVLLALLFYVRYRESDSLRDFWFTLAFYFMAMLSKEIAALVVPLLIISLDFLRERQKLLTLASLSKNRQARSRKTRFALPTDWREMRRYLLFGIPLFLYFAMRQAVLGGLGGLASSGDYLGAYSFLDRLFYSVWLFAQYIKSLVFPYPLAFFRKAPSAADVGSMDFAVASAIVVLFAAALYVAVKKGKHILAFGLLLMGVPLLPVIAFFQIAGESLFAERYILLSGAGFALLIASGLNYLWEAKAKRLPVVLRSSGRRKAVVLLLLGALFLVSVFVVYPRNREWRDNVTFLRATLTLNPDAHSMREHLARALTDQGDGGGAQKEYEEIIARAPDWRGIAQIYNKLGTLYRERGDFDKARENYEKAVQASKGTGDWRAHNNLGVAHMQGGNRLEALTNFCKAIRINPEAQEPKFNFANVASQLGAVDGPGVVLLWRDIIQGSAFQKAEQEGIRYESKECSAGACTYRFATRLERGELLFPFLILGAVSEEKAARAVSPSFDPQTGIIMLGLSSEAQNEAISFIFPTCEGIYYEALAAP